MFKQGQQTHPGRVGEQAQDAGGGRQIHRNLSIAI
jgi:hypothetical protein